MSDENVKPESVLLDALRKKSALNYEGVVDLCDKASVHQCFHDYCELMRQKSESEIVARYPDIPVAKRSAFVKAMKERDNSLRAQIPLTIRGIQSVDELIALTPREFMRRRLEAEDDRLDAVVGAQHARAAQSNVTEREPEPDYSIQRVQFLSDKRVRVFYLSADVADVLPDSFDHEELQRDANGRWGLIAHLSLLLPRAGLLSSDEGEQAV